MATGRELYSEWKGRRAVQVTIAKAQTLRQYKSSYDLGTLHRHMTSQIVTHIVITCHIRLGINRHMTFYDCHNL